MVAALRRGHMWDRSTSGSSPRRTRPPASIGCCVTTAD